MGEKNIQAAVFLSIIFIAFIIKNSPYLKEEQKCDVGHLEKLVKTFRPGDWIWYYLVCKIEVH